MAQTKLGDRRANLRRFLSLEDFEVAARKRLPRPVYTYLAGAAESAISATGNRDSFREFGFVTRVLRDVSVRSTAKTLLGRTYGAPFGIAPMGISALSAYRGDVMLAKASARADIPMIISGASLVPMEEIVAGNPACWFQAYLAGEPQEVEKTIQRVENAGIDTLVVTVDTPVLSNREAEFRAGFTSPLRPTFRLAWDGLVRPRWLAGVFMRSLLTHGLPMFENVGGDRRIPMISARAVRDLGSRGRLNWEHVERIRERWKGKLIIKGILHPDDAARAAAMGFDGIVASNHGGRQLDGALPPLKLLPELVSAAGNMAVLIDGGIRRGADVIKALALGADFVFVGRPFGFAAAVAGEAGVDHAIDLLRREVDRNLAMLGYTSSEQVDSSCLRKWDSGPMPTVTKGPRPLLSPDTP